MRRTGEARHTYLFYQARETKALSLKSLDTAYTNEANEAIKELQKDWVWWTLKDRNRERFIKEVADYFHFVASKANQTRTVGYCYVAIDHEYQKVSRISRECYSNEDIFYKAVKETFPESIASLIAISETLSASTDEIMKSFEDSLKKNHTRMNSGH